MENHRTPTPNGKFHKKCFFIEPFPNVLLPVIRCRYRALGRAGWGASIPDFHFRQRRGDWAEVTLVDLEEEVPDSFSMRYSQDNYGQ